MPRPRREPRLTPPWPPGLESLKKAFLGPRRYRQLPPAGSRWDMYNDSLIVALALNRALKSPEGSIEPYGNSVTGLQVTATLLIDTAPETAKAFIQKLVNAEPYDTEALRMGQSWLVTIHATVDDIHFDAQSLMLAPRKTGIPRLSASWMTAIQTLNSHKRR